MPKRIKCENQSELRQRILRLRWGTLHPSSTSQPILPFNMIANLIGYSASHVAKLLEQEPSIINDHLLNADHSNSVNDHGDQVIGRADQINNQEDEEDEQESITINQ